MQSLTITPGTNANIAQLLQDTSTASNQYDTAKKNYASISETVSALGKGYLAQQKVLLELAQHTGAIGGYKLDVTA